MKVQQRTSIITCLHWKHLGIEIEGYQNQINALNLEQFNTVILRVSVKDSFSSIFDGIWLLSLSCARGTLLGKTLKLL